MSLEELQQQLLTLKAQAYDCIAQTEFLQQQLNQINQQVVEVSKQIVALQEQK